ncbi:MAG: hypothetical protein H7335_01720 [Massilia sp.]|nr:hypothetical protein [Massilia sp.]
MSLSGLALAQTAMNTGVTESTDPAKIAEIERHAQQLASRASATPVMGEREHMDKHGMHHNKDKKHKTMHKRAKKGAAPSEVPMATERKN